MNRNGIVQFNCWSIKLFSVLLLLSTLIFILWGFCPMMLLCIWALVCPLTWSHEQNVDCPNLYRVITWTEMGLYTLIVGVLKYFWVFGAFVCFDFYPWGFCPMMLLSIGAFLCPTTWLFEQNWNCAHLYHVITCTEMGLYTLIVWILKYFLAFWDFCLVWVLSLGLLSIGLFSVPPSPPSSSSSSFYCFRRLFYVRCSSTYWTINSGNWLVGVGMVELYTLISLATNPQRNCRKLTAETWGLLPTSPFCWNAIPKSV